MHSLWGRPLQSRWRTILQFRDEPRVRSRYYVGSSDVSLARLHNEGLKHVNFMFLDHYKPAYVTDVKLAEELGLINPGSILVADNVIKPGNPPYLAYVRRSVQEKRRNLGTATEEGSNGAAPNNITWQYEKRYGIPDLKNREGIRSLCMKARWSKVSNLLEYL